QGGKDIQNTSCDVFFALDVAFEHHRLVRVQWRQVFEHDAMLDRFRLHTVDFVDLYQGEIALAIFWNADFAFDRVACMQIETTNLRGRYIDIVRAGKIRRIGRAQKAETVGQYF